MFRQLARKIRGPRCHVSAEEKAWVERRMTWLNGQFRSGPIRRPPLEPNSEVLPKQWDGSYSAGADLFHRLCQFMQVEPAKLQLHFYSRQESDEAESDYAGENHTQGPAGLYFDAENAPQGRRKSVIALQEELLTEPAHLAATICHELAHVHLLGDGRVDRSEEDGEPLTDLLTVYFGAGILTANSVFQFVQWQSLNMQGWSVRRQGYLSEPLFGYALACFSWYRGDLEAEWRKHLRENIEYYFSDAMHFLVTTSDTTLPFNGA